MSFLLLGFLPLYAGEIKQNSAFNSSRPKIVENNTRFRIPGKSPLPFGELGTKEKPAQVTGILLLVDFPDVQARFTQQELENLVNQVGYNRFGNNGSIRDYFFDITRGKLEYTHVVTRFYRAQKNKAQYDYGNGYQGYQGSDEIIREAVTALDAEFDFSQGTIDSLGNIIGFNVMYAGIWGSTWAQGLWPHRSPFESPIQVDGVKISNYMIAGIQGETEITNELTIGLYAHENGHQLFLWPDTYDHDADSRGLGDYCLMAFQVHKNPQPPSAYFRIAEGFEPFIDITNANIGTVFQAKVDEHIYKYTNENDPKEYFLIEATVQQGRRADIPDEGLMIWHVDENIFDHGTKGVDSLWNKLNSWNQMEVDRHYYNSLEQADFRFHLESNDNNGGPNDLFHGGARNTFNDNTFPNANWWDGTPSGMDITDISGPGETMSFSIRHGSTSIKGIDKSSAITIQSDGNLYLNSRETKFFEISIYNINGDLQFRQIVKLIPGKNILDTNFKEIGIYVYKIKLQGSLEENKKHMTYISF